LCASAASCSTTTFTLGSADALYFAVYIDSAFALDPACADMSLHHHLHIAAMIRDVDVLFRAKLKPRLIISAVHQIDVTYVR
jgi:hypothetical protein